MKAQDQITENTYKVGQTITLKNGAKGKVIEVLHGGHSSINDERGKVGVPVVKGIDFIGYTQIVPTSWKWLYGNETREDQVIKIEG